MNGHLLATIRAMMHVATANLAAVAGATPLPRAAHLVPTWRCNMKCRTCTVWQRAEDEPDLELPEMLALIGQLRCLDIVKMIGGEPFLYEDLNRVGLEVRRVIAPYIFQIISNGTLTEQIVDFVKEVGWPGLHLRLSVDGLAARHAEYRPGQDDSFDKVMKTLEECARLREKVPFVLGVNYNLTDKTIDDLPEMYRICRDLGVDLVPGIPVSPFLENVDIHAAEHRVLDIHDPGRLAAALKPVDYGSKSGVTGWGRRFLKSSNRRIFDGLLAGGEARPFGCREMRSMIYVFPRGQVVLCGLRHLELGSLAENTLDDLWRSERARELRREADACPGCNQAAIVIVSRLYGLYPHWRARRKALRDQ